MDLEELEQHWQAFGEQDPLWAILSAPGKRGGKWDLKEFFATGRAEIDQVLQEIEVSGVRLNRGRALDFGCGVGRLTQALAERFEAADGVDLAGSMIERARTLNPDPERIHFHHNDAPDLRIFPDRSFDFIISLLVLQHMEPKLMRGYLREFIRVLKVGGVAYLNIPEREVRAESLPDEAWRAGLELTRPVETLEAGRVAKLSVVVENRSPAPWPHFAQVRLGNHWRSEAGELLALDEGRADPGRDLAPGDRQEITLEVTAPPNPGRYVLEIDLIQEWISWFSDRGSTPLRVPVTVTEPTVGNQPPEPSESDFTPVMEMHVLPKREVALVVAQAGGRVASATLSRHRAIGLSVMDYVVVRPSPRRTWLTRRLAAWRLRRRGA